MMKVSNGKPVSNLHNVGVFLLKILFNFLKIVKLRRLGIAASKAKETALDEDKGSYNKGQFIQEGFTDPTGTHHRTFTAHSHSGMPYFN